MSRNLARIAAIGTLALVAGCGSNTASTNLPGPTDPSSNSSSTSATSPAGAAEPTAAAGPGTPYPPEVVANFVQSCEAASGGATAVCQCTIDGIQNQLSYDDFVAIDQAAQRGGTTPESITIIAQQCAAAGPS